MIKCPNCHEYAAVVDGNEIEPYRSSFQGKNYFVCWVCDLHIECREAHLNPDRKWEVTE